MPRHSETRVLPWSAAQIYDMIADVARYHEFLPWVNGVRVRSDSETEMTADLIVGFKGLRETFTSRVHKQRPSQITVDYLDGPLRSLRNEWRFADDGKGGCTVDFLVDFAFKSRVFEAIAGKMFESALRKMIEAFEKRAEMLYGVAPGISNSSATSAA